MCIGGKKYPSLGEYTLVGCVLWTRFSSIHNLQFVVHLQFAIKRLLQYFIKDANSRLIFTSL